MVLSGAYLEGGKPAHAPPLQTQQTLGRLHVICHTEITDNGMKVWNLVSWLSGKSLKLLPPDVRF